MDCLEIIMYSKAGELSLSEILIKHDYSLCGLIGKGGFAAVYKVVSRKYDQEFAVKVIDLTNLSEIGR